MVGCCELETKPDLKMRDAKPKHYSCHGDEDLQKERVGSPS